MKKKLLVIGSTIIGIVFLIALVGFLKFNFTNSGDNIPVVNEPLEEITNNEPVVADTFETSEKKPENKLCDWVDKSDIIIKVNFADGVVKDTSYEAGFYLSSIKSTMRLARAACDYRTGFSNDELKNLGAVQVGVRGYTDSRRRQILNEPINVVFDAQGVPDIDPYIEVTITD